MVHIPAPRPSKTQIELRLGDCLEGLQKLPKKSVDLCITSPPYNLGIRYGAYKDDQARDEYLRWSREWGMAVREVLKDDGALFLNVGASPSNPMLPHEMAQVFSDGVFVLQNTIHWIKSISIERDADVSSYGHFKPINSPRFLNDCHEYVFHFTPAGNSRIDRLAVGVPYGDKSNIQRWSHTGGRDKRCRGNTWFIPYKTIQQRARQRPHPATFPTELAVKCIRLHGRADCTVLDPFVGIGHSALGAQECGDLVSRFIGFDIDEEYLKVASEVLGCSYTGL